MVATGCFLAVAGDAVALVRDKTLFVLSASQPQRAVEFQLLSETPIRDAAVKATDDGDDEPPTNHQHVVTVNCITDVTFFAPHATGALALLVLVDERKLVHYDVDIAANSVTYRSLRVLPRNAVCMGVAHVNVANGEKQHVIVAGVKTGEAVAMPFPDITRDVRTLLGHTTSMIVHLAVNCDSTLLLTADRDEKLRVSKFPTTALVQSYCLGHTASLTKVAAASTATRDLAVSTALDNTLKLWHLPTGALLDSVELLEAELATSKALLATSLAVSKVANVVAVVLNNMRVKLFQIDSTTSKLVPLAIATDLQHQLNAHAPADAQFLADGTLVICRKDAPFVDFYSIECDKTSCSATVQSSSIVADSVLAHVRTVFSTIEIAVDEQLIEEFEGGLQKKKVRTAFDYKTKLAKLSATTNSSSNSKAQ